MVSGIRSIHSSQLAAVALALVETLRMSGWHGSKRCWEAGKEVAKGVARKLETFLDLEKIISLT